MLYGFILDISVFIFFFRRFFILRPLASILCTQNRYRFYMFEDSKRCVSPFINGRLVLYFGQQPYDGNIDRQTISQMRCFKKVLPYPELLLSNLKLLIMRKGNLVDLCIKSFVIYGQDLIDRYQTLLLMYSVKTGNSLVE